MGGSSWTGSLIRLWKLYVRYNIAWLTDGYHGVMNKNVCVGAEEEEEEEEKEEDTEEKAILDRLRGRGGGGGKDAEEEAILDRLRGRDPPQGIPPGGFPQGIPHGILPGNSPGSPQEIPPQRIPPGGPREKEWDRMEWGKDNGGMEERGERKRGGDAHVSFGVCFDSYVAANDCRFLSKRR